MLNWLVRLTGEDLDLDYLGMLPGGRMGIT
jgi:hypothetical protein